MLKPDYDPNIAEQDEYGNTTAKNQDGVTLCKQCPYLDENGVCDSPVGCLQNGVDDQ